MSMSNGLLAVWLLSYPQPTVQARSEAKVAISIGKKDANGFIVHEVTSPYQAGTTEIRVLLPDDYDIARKYSVVYVLPVETGKERAYGDGLMEAKKLGLHNKHQAIFVAPTFSHLPWYADHPTRLEIRQETYFVKAVLPFVEKTYSVIPGIRGRFLLGFSKSGWGAFSLLLRHPQLFEKAAGWDAPFMMDTGKPYGSEQVFATQENFERYRLTTLLKANAAALKDRPRLFVFGYGGFRMHHQQVHALMTKLEIAHDYEDGPHRKHDWHSGWVAPAATWLLKKD